MLCLRMQRICLLVVDDDEGDAASISRMVHLRTQLRDFYDETAEVRVDTSSVASRRHDTLVVSTFDDQL